MDVQVRRLAVAVEVKQAARRRRRGPVLHLPGLGRYGRRLLRGHDVVALMRPAGTGRAEIVLVLDLPDDGEDDVRRRLAVRGRSSRPGGEAEHRGEEEDS